MQSAQICSCPPTCAFWMATAALPWLRFSNLLACGKLQPNSAVTCVHVSAHARKYMCMCVPEARGILARRPRCTQEAAGRKGFHRREIPAPTVPLPTLTSNVAIACLEALAKLADWRSCWARSSKPAAQATAFGWVKPHPRYVLMNCWRAVCFNVCVCVCVCCQCLCVCVYSMDALLLCRQSTVHILIVFFQKHESNGVNKKFAFRRAAVEVLMRPPESECSEEATGHVILLRGT